MRFRYLRIAFSATSVIACMLLIALWVRSYWWRDALYGPLVSNQTFNLSAANGRIRFATFDNTYESEFTGERLTGWGLTHSRFKQPLHLTLVNTPLRNFGLGFAGSRDRYGIVAIIPIWFPITLGSVITVATWNGFRWRFSLRTLFIAMTLIAVVLGAIGYAVRWLPSP